MLEDVKVKFDFTVEMRSLKMYIIVSYNCQSLHFMGMNRQDKRKD